MGEVEYRLFADASNRSVNFTDFWERISCCGGFHLGQALHMTYALEWHGMR